MIQVIMRLSQEKGVVDDVGSVNTTIRTQGVTEGPMYQIASFAILEVGTPHCLIPPMVNDVLEIHLLPTPMPSRVVHIYPYMPPPVVPSLPINQVEVNSGMLFTQSLPVQSFDELKEQERKKVEFMMQPKNTETAKSKFD